MYEGVLLSTIRVTFGRGSGAGGNSGAGSGQSVAVGLASPCVIHLLSLITPEMLPIPAAEDVESLGET